MQWKIAEEILPKKDKKVKGCSKFYCEPSVLEICFYSYMHSLSEPDWKTVYKIMTPIGMKI
jgi:hypothetical protein